MNTAPLPRQTVDVAALQGFNALPAAAQLAADRRRREAADRTVFALTLVGLLILAAAAFAFSTWSPHA